MNTKQNLAKRDYDTIEIDLLRLVKVCLRNIWLVLAIALLCGCAAYMGTKLWITPTYRSSFTAYVNNRTTEEDTSLTSSDISAARSLTSTYSTILTSRPVLEEAAEAANLGDMTADDLSNAVTTETVNDTEIIQVNVTMESPGDAAAYATALADVAPAYIGKIIEGSSMQIIAMPVEPTTIYGPDYKRNTTIGILVGGIFIAALVILRDLMDDRVKSVTELEERYGIAVMGTIPDLVAAQKQNFAGYSYGYGKTR